MNRLASKGLSAYRTLTSVARGEPDFLIIGAAKCGTTSLYNYLTSHPQIASARLKEVHYFDIEFQRGSAWYRSNFPFRSLRSSGAGHNRILTGEASPYYIFHPHALRRISEALPQIPMIILLRDPVDRAYSHYNFSVRLGYETLCFEDAIAAEEERLDGEVEKMLADENHYSFSHQHHSYLARGIYANQLTTLERLGFTREQLLVLKTEDFFLNPAEGMKTVWQFLGLSDHRVNSFEKFNFGNYEDMKGETRSNLEKFYRPHNERLALMLGPDFVWH